MNVNVKEKLKTLSVSDSGIDSIMEIMDLPDKQFDAMFPELKKAIGEIYDDEVAVEKTLNDMRKLNVSRTQFMQEAEQLKTLINDIENDNALSKMVAIVKVAEAESRFKDMYPIDHLWQTAPLFSVLNDTRIEIAYRERFGAEFVYGDLPDFDDVKKVILELQKALIRCNV